MKKSGSGIFCLEGEWGSGLEDRRSVQPILDLLDRLDLAESVRRDVATRAEFFYYLKHWAKKSNRRFPILFIACHGEGEHIYVRDASDREHAAWARGSYEKDPDDAPWIELDELASVLDGEAEGRPIYFGSCSTMRADDTTLKAFARKTGAPAVIGYESDVDWLAAASFEVMLLDQIAQNPHNARFFSRVVKRTGTVASELGPVVATKSKVYRAVGNRE